MGAKEIVLHYVGEGKIFGEIACFGRKRTQGRCHSRGGVSDLYRLHARPSADADGASASHAGAAAPFVKKIPMAATIIEDNTLEMRGRTARGLLRLARQHKRAAGAGGFLRLTMS
jgi:hypothetical protein